MPKSYYVLLHHYIVSNLLVEVISIYGVPNKNGTCIFFLWVDGQHNFNLNYVPSLYLLFSNLPYFSSYSLLGYYVF